MAKVMVEKFHIVHTQSILLDLIFIVLLILYILYITMYEERLYSIIRHSIGIEIDTSSFKSYTIGQPFLIAKIIFIISLALTATDLIHIYKINFISLTTAAVITTSIISVIILVKNITIILMGQLSENHHWYKIILYANNCLIALVNVLLIPSVLISYIIPGLYYIPMSIVGLFILFKIIENTRLLIRNKFSLFSIFLYLCTLEILPFIAIATAYKAMN